MHLRRIQPASLAASPDNTEPFAFAPAEFQRACAPPEEELLATVASVVVMARLLGMRMSMSRCGLTLAMLGNNVDREEEAIPIPFQAWLA